MVSPKEEIRFTTERSQSDRYYDDRNVHYYRDVRDDRDLVMSSNNGSTNLGRHSQEPPESERGIEYNYNYSFIINHYDLFT